MVFHGFWLVSIVLLVQNTTNCILAQRSSLGLAGHRPALAESFENFNFVCKTFTKKGVTKQSNDWT